MQVADVTRLARAFMCKEKDGELIPWENGRYIHEGELKVKSGSQIIIVHMERAQVHDLLVHLVKWLKEWI